VRSVINIIIEISDGIHEMGDHGNEIMKKNESSKAEDWFPAHFDVEF
jgi:hypothetical protein